MKHRLERVKEVLKRELGEIIRREIDFDAPLVTVQDVDVTPDLKNAHVFVSVIGDVAAKKTALKTLLDHRQLLQHEVAKRVVMKFTPHLHFRIDETIERGDRVIDILSKIELPPDDEE